MIARFGILITVSALGTGTAVAHDDHDHASTTDNQGTPTAVAGTGNALVYLSVENTGTETEFLTGANTDVAESVSLHASGGDGDVMRMEPLKDGRGFEIGPGVTFELAPGGAHIMLENLRQDLRPGMTYQLRLEFPSGYLTVDVTVGREAPEGEPDRFGNLTISPAWSLPAPMLGDGTPTASPEAPPDEHHH